MNWMRLFLPEAQKIQVRIYKGSPKRWFTGSVMDRVVSQFLAELDAISAGQHDVFVFGATNRVDLIDPALLRPGRLDKLVEVRLPQSVFEKLSILKSLTRKFDLSSDVDLETVAENVQKNASGADLYAICAEAWTFACKRCIAEQRYEPNDAASSDLRFREQKDATATTMTVQQQDFLNAVHGRV